MHRENIKITKYLKEKYIFIDIKCISADKLNLKINLQLTKSRLHSKNNSKIIQRLEESKRKSRRYEQKTHVQH